jgi:hypothetical protein
LKGEGMASAQLLSLRDGVDALLIAGACRPAGLAFLRGSREGWGTAELARWLVGPYAEATSRVPRLDEETEPPVGAGPRVDPLRVREILAAAQDEVEAELACAVMGGTSFVREAIEAGAVAQTLDGIWLALDRPRMRLKDRVLALFASDYLLRPQEYLERLSICEKCGTVAFDPTARLTRQCGAHRLGDGVDLTLRSEPLPALRSA